MTSIIIPETIYYKEKSLKVLIKNIKMNKIKCNQSLFKNKTNNYRLKIKNLNSNQIIKRI